MYVFRLKVGRPDQTRPDRLYKLTITSCLLCERSPHDDDVCFVWLPIARRITMPIFGVQMVFNDPYKNRPSPPANNNNNKNNNVLMRSEHYLCLRLVSSS